MNDECISCGRKQGKRREREREREREKGCWLPLARKNGVLCMLRAGGHAAASGRNMGKKRVPRDGSARKKQARHLSRLHHSNG